MDILCVSDLHGYYPKLEGGDLLIVAGDLTATDEHEQHQDFRDWLDEQAYTYKVVIAGNHDNNIDPDLIDSLKNTIYLCDSGTEFEGLKIWGTPWSSQFPGMNRKCCAFTRPFMESLQDRWDLIPDDVDILITHTPPFGILDQVAKEYSASVGNMDLRKALETRIKPKLHVFGHIHEHGGMIMDFNRGQSEPKTIMINASYVNNWYQPINKPVRIVLHVQNISLA